MLDFMYRSSWLARLVIAFLASAMVVISVRVLPEFVSVEHWITDWRTALFSKVPDTQSDDVIIVTINENTLIDYPYVFPINRGLLSDLLERLDGMDANAILVDIFFDRPTEPEVDERFQITLQQLSTPTVLGYLDERTPLTAEQRRFQADFLENSGHAFGYLNLASSIDGVVRHIPSTSDGSCAFGVLGYVRECTQGANVFSRIDWLLPPSDGQPTFAAVPAQAILAAEPGSLDALFEGRVVLVGAMLMGMDQHRTPISDFSDAGLMPGLEIHAHYIQQLIDGREVRELQLFGELALFALAALFGVVLSTLSVVQGRAPLILFVLSWVLVGLDIGLFIFARLVFPGDAAAFAVIVGYISASVHRALTEHSIKNLANDLGELM